ncbi:M4 family metallopeptidase, partial [Sphaerimonospora thailandensis]|uniref:M4 family metallopeptidase n=1 Tax=Sphaerimonospora thailandensis TaxID=795644 RepID=UPI00194FB122
MRGFLRRLTPIGIAAVAVAATTAIPISTALASTAADPAPDPAITAKADRAIAQHSEAVRAGGSDKYAVSATNVDDNGTAHVRYTRKYHNLRVLGGDFVVHLNTDGAFDGASVGLTAPLTLGVTPKISAADAAAKAKDAFTGEAGEVGKPELIVDASTGNGRLAWETVVSGVAEDGQTPSRLHVITDALAGTVLSSFDEIRHVDGTGNSIYSGTVTISTSGSSGSYSMVDVAHGNGRTCDMNNRTSGTCTTFTDSDNTWGNGSNSNRQSAAVDAHYGASTTFDYFKNVHGRNGIFGNGQGVPSRVHYGSNYVNAFWDGSQMTYGDGSGNSRPLVAIDVAGHEMSHGVTERTANLTYSGESGGLNEATSDIFGSMVEFYADNTSDPGDYDIGEKINIRGDGSPLRYMYNPSLDGSSHSCWSTSTNSVDVHYSSGVGNHFFFMLAEGSGSTRYGNSPVCGSAPAVTGIGRDKAAKIWFQALANHFTSSTRYVNSSNPGNTARAYTLRAATDLYGNCSTEYKAVQAAWTAVNVAGNDSTCGGNPNPSPSPTVSPSPGPTSNPGTCTGY